MQHCADRGHLQDTRHVCVEEQLALFLYTLEHNVKYRMKARTFIDLEKQSIDIFIDV